jgi:6-pyruvoyltetrahydropterin/6-carboxytetrahydropterin synthase
VEISREFHKLKGDFQIRIEGRFEASHYLYRYFPDGSDEPLHGHSYFVELFLARKGGGTGSDGISYDFVKAKERLDRMLSRVEHAMLNDLPEFRGVNTTAENLARWFYAGLRDVVEPDGGEVREIRVHEGPGNVALFRPLREEGESSEREMRS